MLGYRDLNPLLRHLLPESYRASKVSFLVGEEWTTGYVSSWPLPLEQWERGSHMVAQANPDRFLGVPGLDALEILFVADSDVILANLLSGAVDYVSSAGVRASEAVVARDQWVAGGQGYLKS